jgi:serine/threonine protein kinase
VWLQTIKECADDPSPVGEIGNTPRYWDECCNQMHQQSIADTTTCNAEEGASYRRVSNARHLEWVVADNWNNQVEREIALMKLLNHPNVLEMYDVYESRNYLYVN